MYLKAIKNHFPHGQAPMFEPSGGAKNNLKKMKKVAILSLFILVGCVKKLKKRKLEATIM